MNPFELYKANVLMLNQYELDLLTYKRVDDKDKVLATQSKIKSLNKVVRNYEKTFRFKRDMIYSK